MAPRENRNSKKKHQRLLLKIIQSHIFMRRFFFYYSRIFQVLKFNCCINVIIFEQNIKNPHQNYFEVFANELYL